MTDRGGRGRGGIEGAGLPYHTRGGSNRGGGGDSRGGYDRGQGGSGDGGRGNFRGAPAKGPGGRGRGGGGGARNTADDGVFGDGINVPSVNKDITKIENDFIKSNAALVSTTGGIFPLRPAHGIQGTAIVVYANSFEVTVKPLTFFRYNVEVKEVAGGSTKGKAASGVLRPNLSKKKKKRLFEILMEDKNFSGCMTDFADFFISQGRLVNVPAAGLNVRVAFKKQEEDDAAPNAPHFEFRIIEAGSLSTSAMLDYLRATNTKLTAPMRNETIQALNVVVNQSAQLNLAVASGGQNKFFALHGAPSDRTGLGGGLEALRGVFKSIRPATARFLLNVNVSHAVCYEAVSLDEMIRKLPTSPTVIQKFLKLVQIQRLHLTMKKNKSGRNIPATKTIWGLANTNDGFGQPNPPQIASFGAGPKGVKFWLASEQESGTASSSKKGKGSKGSKAGASAQTGISDRGYYISVYDFFRQNYSKFTLDARYPVVNVGSRENPVYLPAEVCQILPGQAIGRKLDPNQTANMIKFACRRPKANVRFITSDARAVLGLDVPDNSSLAKNGISIGNSLVTVPARQLKAPDICYRYAVDAGKIATPGAKTLAVRFGSWNMAGVSFHQGVEVKSWMWIYPGPHRFRVEEVTNALQRFVKFMKTMGVNLSGPPNPYLSGMVRSDQVKGRLLRTDGNAGIPASSEKPTFCIVVLPSKDASLYGEIKSIGDRQAGVQVCHSVSFTRSSSVVAGHVVNRDQTICCQAEQLAKTSEQYFANVAMKFNLKAGGINSVLVDNKLGIVARGKTMVVGLDVTHPQPGSAKNAPSVAGMVASINKHLAQWPAVLKVQEGRKELVNELGHMFATRLEIWKKHNNSYPDNVLIYRDGVSEGQYQAVLDIELPALRAAATSLYPADLQKRHLPRITIVIVGKRHHTRFYPTVPSQAERSFNCMPGTVVDRGVVEVRNWDFFLQAHSCLQGTARPAHYYVILDEIFKYARKENMMGLNKAFKSAADDLEDLTHNMCHLFGRATKAVSICPPAYYADLLCERARSYLGQYYEPPTPSNMSATGSATSATAPSNGDVQIHPDIVDTMFYI